ncbi:hypothetical protein CDD83_3730 [Cordyceps sp. RAO-2017]|nr:hypothetical protein CDD83_3730 [Cordyceps sp. RAO-2017]
MGAIGAVIKFVIIPIAIVVLLGFAVVLVWQHKKRSKDVEKAEPLPPVNMNYAQPPAYIVGPDNFKPPAGVGQTTHPVN